MDEIVLPASVKVGWKTFAIESWPPHEAHENRRYGETRHQTRKIMVITDYGALQAAETLIHEILHTIYDIWDIKDEDDEERTVHSIAAGLASVGHNNPEVFAWIAKNLAGDVA